ncbi:AAA family ATPase [Streptomyces antimycoticus]
MGATGLATRLAEARAGALVGREPERAVLDRMLSGAGDAPLVAYLHGPGGIGKSSLVRSAAWRAELAGRRVVQVDARFLDADPRRLEEAAAPACAEPGAVLPHDRRTARAASRGRESDFLTWWFDWLSAVPGTFPPEEVATVASSYRGYEALRAGFSHYRTLLEDGRVNRAWHETGGALPMPVLAVGGEHSTGARLADSLNTVAPRLTGAVIAGSGHFVPEERPNAFADELLPFLSAPLRRAGRV